MRLRCDVRFYPTAGQRQALALARSFGCARVAFNDAVAARREAWADGRRTLSDAEVPQRFTGHLGRKPGPSEPGGSPSRDRVSCSSACDSQAADLNCLQHQHETAAGRAVAARGPDVSPGATLADWSEARTSTGLLREAVGIPVVHGREDVKEAKKASGRAWLGEVPSVVLQQAVAVANTAHRNWLSSLSGRLKGSKVAEPGFWSRRADVRRDVLHKFSPQIIRENQAVSVEDLAVKDLAVKGLARTRPATSVHDRDVNAARNILTEGRRTAAGRAVSACGGDVRPGSGPADPAEAGTHRSAA